MTTDPRASQILCAFFAASNLFFYLLNEDVINLVISVAMDLTVAILELTRRDYE